ncbi:MAG: ECF transporter S component [Candidatus Zixiibacteriota bacterium]|nr:MAG: ECF transporter S component [candidate division Zixibacteria bacterium]
MRRTRSLTLAALLMAAGLALGLVFHALGVGGQVALPLHYPPLLAGFLLGGGWGMAVGALLPPVSALATGMPPLFPSALLMIPELAVYGAASGYLRRSLGVIPSLLAALILGRAAWGLAAWVLLPLLGFRIPVLAALGSGLLLGLPGLLGQIVVVPLLVRRIETLRPVPARHPLANG